MSLIDLGEAEQYTDGELHLVNVGGARSVGILHWHGRFFAVRNYCPHQAAPLCAGRVIQRIVAGGVGDLNLDKEEAPTIVCPWHSWEFDMATGRSLSDPRLRVKTHPTSLRDGRLYLEVRT